MTLDHADRFIVLFCGGVGMALAGGANALAGRLGAVGRSLLTALGCSAALGGVAALTTDPNLLTTAAAVMALGLVPTLLAGSLTGLLRRTAELAARPVVRWGSLAAVGVCTAAAAAGWFQYEDAVLIERDMRELGLEYSRPPLIHSDAVARTDRGTPVPGKSPSAPRNDAEMGELEQKFLQATPFRDQLMRQRKADDGSNCHGWVFTGGRYWLDPDSVELVLRENGYVDVRDPQPGDLTIYRNNGSISHTGIVRYVTAGAPALVEGKWGPLGVYLHPVDQCPYGTPTFYRSVRHGHLLTGLDGSSLSAR
jgi:hypothetical protein